MSSWQGGHGAGARDYTPQERDVIVRRMLGLSAWVTAEQLEQLTGIAGRTARQILADADGIEFVLEIGQDGYRRCETWEEAQRGTARLESQVRQMQARIDRRKAFAEAELERVQGVLF